MSYGVEIRNDNLRIQIDATYKNYSLKESDDNVTISNAGLVDTETEFALLQATTVNFAASVREIPVVAFQPDTDYFVNLLCLNKSGENYTGFKMVTECLSSAVSTDVNWQMFLPGISSADENYGLKVYNATKKLVFDSGWRILKILGIESNSLAVPETSTVTVTHSYATNPYYIVAPGDSYYLRLFGPGAPAPDTWLKYIMGIKKKSSTEVYLNWFPYQASVTSLVSVDTFGGFNPTVKLIVCEAI